MNPNTVIAANIREAVQQCPKVFVYGSLKTGHWNHGLLAGLPRAKTGFLLSGHKLIQRRQWSIPFAVPSDNPEDRVVGELFPISYANGLHAPEVLQSLDVLEGHPQWYTRTRVRVRRGEGYGAEEYAAWAYILNPHYATAYLESPNTRTIPTGEWPYDFDKENEDAA